MPLTTYPDAVPDDSIKSAVDFASHLNAFLEVAVYAVTIPQLRSPLGGILLDIPEMVRVAEERSRNEARRLDTLVKASAGPKVGAHIALETVVLGSDVDAATERTRHYDLAILPWSQESQAAQDIAQAVVFGSGRPAILVPPSASIGTPLEVAVAWDGGAAAARALGDALSVLPPELRITVLTVRDEKPLARQGLASALAASLEDRGYAVKAREVELNGRRIAEALQDAAIDSGARLLIMGAFGHSRLREFILGGATNGVLANLRLPTLLSH